MTEGTRLVPPPRPVVVAAPPSAPQAAYGPGHVICWVSHAAMWVATEGNGTDAVAAMRLDQAERHLEHVKACIAELKGEPVKPSGVGAGRAALAIEGGKP